MVQIEESQKEVQINILQSDSDSYSEIEDLLNPKDELKKKIVTLAGTIRNWNEEHVKVRKSVSEQLKGIRDLDLNKYKMQKDELRNLVYAIFRYHGISESWIRKLLPVELKDTSKTRLSYLQKQEIEKERELLLQQYPELRQRSETKEYSLPDSSVMISAELQALPSPSKSRHDLAQEYTLSHETLDPRISVSEDSISMELKTVQSKLDEANKKIDRLEANVQQVSEPFIAKAYLQVVDQDIPIVVQVDPVKKAIISVQLEKSY